MKLKLRRVNPWSLALVFAKLYFVMAAVFGFFFAIASTFGKNGSFLMGIGIYVAMLVLYPIMGWLGGAFCAWIYNVICGSSSPVELEFDSADQEPK